MRPFTRSEVRRTGFPEVGAALLRHPSGFVASAGAAFFTAPSGFLASAGGCAGRGPSPSRRRIPRACPCAGVWADTGGEREPGDQEKGGADHERGRDSIDLIIALTPGISSDDLKQARCRLQHDRTSRMMSRIGRHLRGEEPTREPTDRGGTTESESPFRPPMGTLRPEDRRRWRDVETIRSPGLRGVGGRARRPRPLRAARLPGLAATSSRPDLPCGGGRGGGGTGDLDGGLRGASPAARLARLSVGASMRSIDLAPRCLGGRRRDLPLPSTFWFISLEDALAILVPVLLGLELLGGELLDQLPGELSLALLHLGGLPLSISPKSRTSSAKYMVWSMRPSCAGRTRTRLSLPRMMNRATATRLALAMVSARSR